MVDPATAPELRRLGEIWTVRYGSSLLHLEDRDGLHYLALLLEAPSVEVHVLDLLARAGRARSPGPRDAGPLLDRAAVGAYRRRVKALAERGPGASPERQGAEVGFLRRELSRAVGLGGRERRACADDERARVNVTLRIRTAIRRIEPHHALLAHHLSTCVKTGLYCVYRPPPAPDRRLLDPPSTRGRVAS